MTSLSVALADLVAIGVLCFAVYYPRHRRQDLLVAFLGVNVGVLAVTTALVSSDATLGLGLGLFGVLSIIRLRSFELGQHEVAYYFIALALGLLGGLGSLHPTLTVSLMALLVVVVAFADSPALFARDHQRSIVLDGAHPDEREVVGHLETLLDGPVTSLTVRKVDLVNDTTVVDVRWRSRAATSRRDDAGAPTCSAGTVHA